MRRVIRASLLVAVGNAVARCIYFLSHPEYSVALWTPVCVAFAGAFIGSFAVLSGIMLVRTFIKQKGPSK